LLNSTTANGITIITGHAWTQSAEIDRVEFRIGDGEWTEATYEETQMELGPLTPFNWTIALDAAKMPAGENTVEIRVVSGESHSLPVIVTVIGSAISDGMSADLTMVIAIGGLIILLIATAGFVTIRSRVDLLSEDMVIEAEIIEAEPDVDYSSLTVPQLKEVLSERGLPITGKKAGLIERLESNG